MVYIHERVMAKSKTARQLERHLKGAANHHRIEILQLIARRKAITLQEIVEALSANEKTIGEHTRRLFVAGLIQKKYRGSFVEHSLSPYGQIFVEFIQHLQAL